MPFFKGSGADDDKGGGGGAGGNFLTKDMGPLPVWGWAALAVASIFLFRMMTKPKVAPTDPNAQQSPVPYPTGGVGGVFLIPSGNNAPPSSVTPPATTPPAAGGTAGLWDFLTRTSQQLLTNAYTERQAAAPGIDPYPPAGMAFLQQTHVQSQLGLPHVVSEGGVGYVLNPASGKKVLASTFNAMPENQRMLLTVGDANAWAAM